MCGSGSCLDGVGVLCVNAEGVGLRAASAYDVVIGAGGGTRLDAGLAGCGCCCGWAGSWAVTKGRLLGGSFVLPGSGMISTRRLPKWRSDDGGGFEA